MHIQLPLFNILPSLLAITIHIKVTNFGKCLIWRCSMSILRDCTEMNHIIQKANSLHISVMSSNCPKPRETDYRFCKH